MGWSDKRNIETGRWERREGGKGREGCREEGKEELTGDK